ncbi:TetR/AcrR family transcriptional regulator [Glaciihabitans sp. dw_435]|uniref:TetR/AcrR family transcriptional regulator n=1 Tax=Glaciihabitans sp. dw_435 TaxID=2720081 RepID=UPI001BD566DD|nr:TetR/AcrR family transcriptional regulator [Glaciihabitans sp. dw_435]
MADMTVTDGGKTLRQGSAVKREAILGAARGLFLAEGFERTSVDAIAALAQVSKRTVYDYFGDKRALLLSVVEQALGTLMSVVDRAIADHLTEVQDLEASLIAFARSISETAIGSADYVALIRLVSNEAANLPELRAHNWAMVEPEVKVADRLAAFAEQGLLVVPDPRMAADHLTALTMTPSMTGATAGITTTNDETQRRIVAGVRAFIRAYEPRG